MLKQNILSFLLVVSFFVYAHKTFAQNCGNVGFENGDNAGWTGYIGDCTGGPVGGLPTLNISGVPTPWTTPQYFYDGVNEFPSFYRWKIMTPTDGVGGFDSIIPSIPVVSPWGGTRSIRLGNWLTGSNAERLVFHYSVDASNANFVYQYAVIMNSTAGLPHTSDQQPAFRIKITNSSGVVINPTCGLYNIYAAQAGVGFTTITDGSYDISYRNWSLASIDLSPFIGQTINLEFTTNDCTQSGHYGYAYIDCSCVPLTLSTTYCSGAATADVTGPDGYISYSWIADASINYPPPAGPVIPIGNTITTNQTIIIPSYDTTTVYTVNLIPYQGFQCATQLNYVFNPVPSLIAEFDYTTYCGNTPSEFVETSLVLNNGQPPNAWQWYFGDGDSSDVQNPNHHYPILPIDTNYVVMLIVHAGSSCKDTIIDTVFVPSGLNIDTVGLGLGITDVKCNGASDGTVKVHVTGSAGATFTYSWVLPFSASPSDTSVVGIPPNATTVPYLPLYWFKAYDAVNGCSDSISFVITEPPPLVATIPTKYISCHGAVDTLIAIVTGGVPPYNIIWSTLIPQFGDTALNISAGTYSINVLDTNNCSTGASGLLIDGSELHYRLHTSDISCHGLDDGTASIQLYDGKPPYALAWHITGLAPVGVASDTNQIPGLKRNNNYVVIHNSNGCDDDTITFSIIEPDTLQSLITSTNTACYVATTGALKVDVIGGTQPYNYLWTHDFYQNTTQGINNLEQGMYHLKITDNNNCIYETDTPVLYDSDLVVTAKPDFVYDAVANNNLWVTVNKAHQYTYTWSNSQFIDDPSSQSPNLKEIFYTQPFRVDVIDEFGCTGFDSVYVDALPLLFFPTAFSPNGDKLNDTLEIAFSSYHISNFQISIYDRWGRTVFENTNPKFKWDGKHEGGETAIGIYNYTISYLDNRKKKQIKNGILSILK